MLRSQPKIEFDAALHRYTVNGIYLPSVTRVLNFRDPLASAFYKNNGAKERGTAIHRMFERLDQGTLIPELWKQYAAELDHYQQFLADYAPKWHGAEVLVAHPELGYAGTIDRPGAVSKYPKAIVDFKTGSSVPKSAALQTAGYATAYYEDPRDCFRCVLHIHPKRLKTYKVVVYDDPADFIEWEQACRDFQRQGESA